MAKNNNLSDSAFSDTQIERSLIMSLLTDDNGTGHAKALKTYLLEDDFTDESHRNMWRIMMAVVNDGQNINMVNVHTKAKAMGVNVEMSRYVMVNNNFFSDIQAQGFLLHEMGQKRRMSDRLLDVMMNLQDSQYSTTEAVAEMDSLIQEINQSSSLNFEVWSSLHKKVLQLAEDKANGKIPTGVMTGIGLIDRKGGLEPGEGVH